MVNYRECKNWRKCEPNHFWKPREKINEVRSTQRVEIMITMAIVILSNGTGNQPRNFSLVRNK